jgi:DNA-binding transcriptional MerR regulator
VELVRTVGQLANRFGISRGTLLHYDAIGLLRPSGRSASGYRLYSDEDMDRLSRIVAFREAGLPLKAIGSLLDSGASASEKTFERVLEQRLTQINEEIHSLRLQQQVIVRLLKDEEALSRTKVLDKQQWVDLLRATGLDEQEMWRWHQEFERRMPEAHQDFLDALGISESEIRAIRCSVIRTTPDFDE